jgi:hypothetical protein
LRVLIALRKPFQELTLGGRYPFQQVCDALGSARLAAGVESVLLRVVHQTLPFVHAALLLPADRMPQRLPKVRQGVLDGVPVEKDLQQGIIYQRRGV